MFRLTILATCLLLIACDKQTIAIQPEHISIAELNEKLGQAFPDIENLSEMDISSNQQELILSGNPAFIAKAITVAEQLDKPYSYYLEVSNTPRNTISTTMEYMKILLHPDQSISLGHIMLTESPWQELIKEQQRFLQLSLDSNLVLAIDIKNSQDQKISFYSGKHPMQLDQWLMAFDDSEVRQGKKVVTSRPKRQLWLRLVKANSQSDSYLR